MKIATHDSSTGERPINLISWLLIPFARTQGKTLKEQYDVGCRYFDIRLKPYKGTYHVGHGLYVCKKTFDEVMSELNSLSTQDDPIYVEIAYEGKLVTKEEQDNYKSFIDNIVKNTYPDLCYGNIIVKYTDQDMQIDWVTIEQPEYGFPQVEYKFKALNGRCWQTYIPIPWLWKKVYYNHPQFNNEKFIMVDFL